MSVCVCLSVPLCVCQSVPVSVCVFAFRWHFHNLWQMLPFTLAQERRQQRRRRLLPHTPHSSHTLLSQWHRLQPPLPLVLAQAKADFDCNFSGHPHREKKKNKNSGKNTNNNNNNNERCLPVPQFRRCRRRSRRRCPSCTQRLIWNKYFCVFTCDATITQNMNSSSNKTNVCRDEASVRVCVCDSVCVKECASVFVCVCVWLSLVPVCVRCRQTTRGGAAASKSNYSYATLPLAALLTCLPDTIRIRAYTQRVDVKSYRAINH